MGPSYKPYIYFETVDDVVFFIEDVMCFLFQMIENEFKFSFRPCFQVFQRKNVSREILYAAFTGPFKHFTCLLEPPFVAHPRFLQQLFCETPVSVEDNTYMERYSRIHEHHKIF